MEALGDTQLLEFGEIEIERVPATIGAATLWKARGDIGDGVQVDVVQHHRHIVAAEHDILLNVVGTERVGHGHRLQGVLGQMTAGTAVGDDGSGNGLGLGEQGDQKQKQGGSHAAISPAAAQRQGASPQSPSRRTAAGSSVSAASSSAMLRV